MMDQKKKKSCNRGGNKIRTVGKYELGATLGEGTFGKVKKGIHRETRQEVAIKIIDKEKVRQQNMGVQIKREVNIMKQIGLREENSNVVKLYEVLASKSKIYLILELVTGGELFDRIVKEKRFTENKARVYFRQLVNSVELCHSLGICHRDLKPENLLLDENDNLKISDFGLSALYSTGEGSMLSSRAQLLHTTCGTPNYVAPEVLKDQGYDGRKADIWSMGVILFVLVVGSLPFDEKTLPKLFDMIQSADFPMPSFLSAEVADLISSILVADPEKRSTISEIKSHPWFNVSSDTNESFNPRSKSLRLEKQDAYFTSHLSFEDVKSKIRKQLKEMGFKLDNCQQSMTIIKASRITSYGMIGIVVVICEKDGAIEVQFKKGKGDLMEYNCLLNELIKRRLNDIIIN